LVLCEIASQEHFHTSIVFPPEISSIHTKPHSKTHRLWLNQSSSTCVLHANWRVHSLSNPAKSRVCLNLASPL
jgi:hypothetical protein